MNHDPAYKKLFSQPRLIEDLLTGFVPQPWIAELDFSTLEKCNVHFVTPQLGWRQSDVLWRVQLRGQWLYVLILLEFQSRIDRWMPLRVGVYLGLLYLERTAPCWPGSKRCWCGCNFPRSNSLKLTTAMR